MRKLITCLVPLEEELPQGWDFAVLLTIEFPGPNTRLIRMNE